MTNKLKILITLTAICVSSNSFAAGAAQLTGVKGTLKNVERAIKAAVSKAEELYEQNGGATMSSVSLLAGAPETPFLDDLTITESYVVTIAFKDLDSLGAFIDSAATGANATIPVARALSAAVIKLIPVYHEGDSVITSWECITDADAKAKVFMGATSGDIAGNISFISTNGNNGTNEYLSNCIFVDTATFGGDPGGGSGSGGGDPLPPPPFP